MRHETVAKTVFDRVDVAAHAEPDIDDHEIGTAIPSRSNGDVSVERHRDHDMAEILRDLRKPGSSTDVSHVEDLMIENDDWSVRYFVSGDAAK